MRRTAPIALFAVLALAAPLAAGCGPSSSDAGDKIAEKMIEDQSGGDVKIDSDNGEVSIKGKDGESMSMGKTMPKGFPSDVKIPKSVKITSGSSLGDASKPLFNVTGASDESIKELNAAFAKNLGSGWKADSEMAITTSNSSVVSWKQGDSTLSLVLSRDQPGAPKGTTVVVSIAPSS